jgi:membrane-bound serine protease (ClpP class)
VARASGILAVAAGIVVAALWAFARHLPSGSRLRGVFLQDATSREAGYISGTTRDDLIGAEGTAVTDLRPAGVVKVGQERLDVVSDAGFVAKGTQVKIIRSEGYRHVVEPVADTPAQVGGTEGAS